MQGPFTIQRSTYLSVRTIENSQDTVPLNSKGSDFTFSFPLKKINTFTLLYDVPHCTVNVFHKMIVMKVAI